MKKIISFILSLSLLGTAVSGIEIAEKTVKAETNVNRTYTTIDDNYHQCNEYEDEKRPHDFEYDYDYNDNDCGGTVTMTCKDCGHKVTKKLTEIHHYETTKEFETINNNGAIQTNVIYKTVCTKCGETESELVHENTWIVDGNKNPDYFSYKTNDGETDYSSIVGFSSNIIPTLIEERTASGETTNFVGNIYVILPDTSHGVPVTSVSISNYFLINGFEYGKNITDDSKLSISTNSVIFNGQTETKAHFNNVEYIDFDTVSSVDYAGFISSSDNLKVLKLGDNIKKLTSSGVFTVNGLKYLDLNKIEYLDGSSIISSNNDATIEELKIPSTMKLLSADAFSSYFTFKSVKFEDREDNNYLFVKSMLTRTINLENQTDEYMPTNITIPSFVIFNGNFLEIFKGNIENFTMNGACIPDNKYSNFKDNSGYNKACEDYRQLQKTLKNNNTYYTNGVEDKALKTGFYYDYNDNENIAPIYGYAGGGGKADIYNIKNLIFGDNTTMYTEHTINYGCKTEFGNITKFTFGKLAGTIPVNRYDNDSPTDEIELRGPTALLEYSLYNLEDLCEISGEGYFAGNLWKAESSSISAFIHNTRLKYLDFSHIGSISTDQDGVIFSTVTDNKYLEKIVVGDKCKHIGGMHDNPNLTEVVLGDNITTIYPYCFSGCNNITKLNIPKNLKELGDYSISDTKIEKLNFPSHIKYVEALGNLPELKEITYNADVDYYKTLVSDDLDTSVNFNYREYDVNNHYRLYFDLSDNTKLETVKLTLPSNAFVNATSNEGYPNLTTVELDKDGRIGSESATGEGSTNMFVNAGTNVENGVNVSIGENYAKSIGKGVLKNAKINSISFGDQIEKIESGSLQNTVNTKKELIYDLPDALTSWNGFGNTYATVLKTGGLKKLTNSSPISSKFVGLKELYIENAKEVQESALVKLPLVNKIELGGNLKTFNAKCSSENTGNLKTFIMNDALQELGYAAFKDSTVENIKFSNNLIIIGNSAFENVKLDKVNLSKTVEVVGDNAFANSNINDIIFEDDYENERPSDLRLGDNAFYNSSINTLKLNNRIYELDKNTFANCSTLSSIYMSKNLYSMEEDTFKSCNNLSKVYTYKHNIYNKEVLDEYKDDYFSSNPEIIQIYDIVYHSDNGNDVEYRLYDEEFTLKHYDNCYGYAYSNKGLVKYLYGETVCNVVNDNSDFIELYVSCKKHNIPVTADKTIKKIKVYTEDGEKLAESSNGDSYIPLDVNDYGTVRLTILTEDNLTFEYEIEINENNILTFEQNGISLSTTDYDNISELNDTEISLDNLLTTSKKLSAFVRLLKSTNTNEEDESVVATKSSVKVIKAKVKIKGKKLKIYNIKSNYKGKNKKLCKTKLTLKIKDNYHYFNIRKNKITIPLKKRFKGKITITVTKKGYKKFSCIK